MKAYDRIRVDQWFLTVIGVVLLVLALAGAVFAAKAAVASRLSFQSQFGSERDDVEKVLDNCRRAYALYPHNYYFSIYAAEMAYYRAPEAQGSVRSSRLRQANLWCDRGLQQNPYKSQLRRLKTRFLWEDSPAKAIEYWRDYTDWHFWEPHNHATLAELQARAGEFEEAEKSLAWVKVDPAAHEAARRVVQREKDAWDVAVKGGAEEWGE